MSIWMRAALPSVTPACPMDPGRAAIISRIRAFEKPGSQPK
ncbi:hypothetical protein ACL00T_06260 [Curtobacterium flaccumfaciens]